MIHTMITIIEFIFIGAGVILVALQTMTYRKQGDRKLFSLTLSLLIFMVVFAINFFADKMQ